MQRTPGQMPVDSHSTRLRDPDHPDHPDPRNPKGCLSLSCRSWRWCRWYASPRGWSTQCTLQSFRRKSAETPNLPGPRTALRWRRVDAVVHGKRQRPNDPNGPNDQIYMPWPSQGVCATKDLLNVIYHYSFCSDSFSCICSFPFGFWEIMDVYIPPHKLACLSMSFTQRLQPRFQRTFWQRWISVWSFMQRYQIIQSCMVVCKVCEIDAVSLLPEGSFASACEGECRTMLYDRKEWALEHCKMSRYCKHVLPEQWGCRGHHKVKMMRRRQLSEGLDSVVMTSFESSTFWRKRFPT